MSLNMLSPAQQIYDTEIRDSHLKHVLAKGLLTLAGALLHSTLKVGEKWPHGFVTVLEVAVQ